MIENEINLIADKLGMTINQVYQMNLQYQQFGVMRNTFIISLATLTFIIFIGIGFYQCKRWSIDERYELLFLFILLGIVTSNVIGMIIAGVFDTIILPMTYPEYTAMLQTVDQLQSFIP